MARVRYNLRNKQDDPALIVLIYRFNGKRLVHSTGLTVPLIHWNDREMRARETADNLDGDIVNDKLDKLEARVKEIHREFKRQDIEPTVRQIKERLDPASSAEDIGRLHSVLEFIDLFVLERELSPRYARGSIQVYNTARKHIKAYCRARRVEFDYLTGEFLDGFIKYLYRQDFTDNHVNKIWTTLRTMLNNATDRGWHSNMSYKSRKLTAPKQEVDSVFITIQEFLASLAT